MRCRLASPAQRSEQYFTLTQFFAQALRQTIGLPHWTHGFSGRCTFDARFIRLTWGGMSGPASAMVPQV